MTSSNAKQDHDTFEECIKCVECGDAVMAEYNLQTEVKLYEYDPYNSTYKQKVSHEHQARPSMKQQIARRIDVVKRMLLRPDPGDYHYLSSRRDVN